MRIKGFCCVTGGPSSRHGTIIVSLYRAKGGCGVGGVVQRSLQREKDSGDSGK